MGALCGSGLVSGRLSGSAAGGLAGGAVEDVGDGGQVFRGMALFAARQYSFG